MEINNKLDSSSSKKSKMLSIRLTEEQFTYLDRMVGRVKEHTGTQVTRSSIVIKMLEYGLPNFEKDFPELFDASLQKGA
jgi:hypothetical protein